MRKVVAQHAGRPDESSRRGHAPRLADGHGPEHAPSDGVPVSTLIAAGFSEEQAAAAGATVDQLHRGLGPGRDHADQRPRGSGYSWDQFAAEMSERVEALPLDRYPTIRRMLPMLLGHHHDQPFEYGLDALHRRAGTAARPTRPSCRGQLKAVGRPARGSPDPPCRNRRHGARAGTERQARQSPPLGPTGLSRS